VAYWYQTLPTAPFPALPDRDHFTLNGLFFRSVRNNDAAFGALFFGITLHENTIM
jgi:hypothetical protein